MKRIPKFIALLAAAFCACGFSSCRLNTLANLDDNSRYFGVPHSEKYVPLEVQADRRL